MAALISDAHAKCYFAFESVLDLLEHPPESFKDQISRKEVQEEFEKYKIWAGNVGAAHSGKRYEISLDYRLREASFFKSQILNLLGTLNDKIVTASSLLRGERKPFEDQANEGADDLSESSSSKQDGDEGEAEKDTDEKSDEESDESPWEISSNSSEDSTTSENDKPTARKSLRETSADKPTAPANPILTLGRTPQAEMPRLLESIKFTIGCLYRVPIRKPAPLDRLKSQLSIDSALYQHFDVMYIKDKFPLVDEALATRLGKMITRRRQILYYREAHKQSLDTARVQPKVAPVIEARTEAFAIIGGPGIEAGVTGSQTAPSQKTFSQAASSHFTLRSKATTVKPGEMSLPLIEENVDVMALYAPSVAESKSSMASSFAGKDLRIEVPSRPRNESGEEMEWFECPYCLITKNITTTHKWKKHVFEDLQPYVCTYGDCDLYSHFFESRDAWFKHEAQQHRTKWFCNTDNHPEYDGEDEFLAHMTRFHDASMDEAQFSLLRDVFRHPTRSMEGVCNLCMRPSKKLRSHVSRHLQQIALFALPRVNETAGSGKAERDHDSSQDAKKHKDRNSEADSRNESGSSSRSNDTSPIDPTATEVHEEAPEIVDEFEAGDVPEVTDVVWDDVTDKFSKARQREYRPLNVLVFGRYSPTPLSVCDGIEHFKCKAKLEFVSDEALRHLAIDKYDIVIINVRNSGSGDQDRANDLARAIRNGAADAHNTQIPIVALVHNRLAVSGNHYYDAVMEYTYGNSNDGSHMILDQKLTEVFGRLCAWQRPSLDLSPGPAARTGSPSDDAKDDEKAGVGVEEQSLNTNPDENISPALDATSNANKDVNVDVPDATFQTAGASPGQKSDWMKYCQPQQLAMKQLEILAALMQDNPRTQKLRHLKMYPGLVNIHNNIKTAGIPYLRWDTFREVLTELSRLTKPATSHDMAYLDRVDDLLEEERGSMADLPKFSIGDMVAVQDGEIEMLVHEMSWIEGEGWTYTRTRPYFEAPHRERTLKLLQPSESHTDEHTIYTHYDFHRFPCRMTTNCVHTFDSIAERDEHEVQEACNPHDPRELYHYNRRLMGYFCRNLECRESMGTFTERQAHEQQCRYNSTASAVDTTLKRRFPCRDCSKIFDSVESRDRHEDLNCEAGNYFCRHRGCYASFKGKENRKSHESTCAHQPHDPTAEPLVPRLGPQEEKLEDFEEGMLEDPKEEVSDLTFRCRDGCDEVFSSHTERYDHEALDCLKLPVFCRNGCAEEFQDRKARQEHEKARCKLPVDCGNGCLMQFFNHKARIEHEKTDCVLRPGLMEDEKVVILTCRDGCGATFESSTALKLHEDNECKELFACCRIGCTEKFDARHDRLQHEMNRICVVKASKFACRDGCGFQFPNIYSRDSHENLDCERWPVYCRNGCLAEFDGRSNRLYHEVDRCIRKPLPTSGFACFDGCQRVYFTIKDIENHEDNECTELPVFCRNDGCTFQFDDREKRKQHEGREGRCAHHKDRWRRLIPNKIMKCFNEGCKMTFVREIQRADHSDNQCLWSQGSTLELGEESSDWGAGDPLGRPEYASLAYFMWMDGLSNKQWRRIPSHVTKVRALYDFAPSDSNQLPFQNGDIITVVNADYENWWRGTLRGVTGIFPLNYVEKLEYGEYYDRPEHLTADKVRVVRALYDFEPKEAKDLAFKKGDVINVIESASKEWWKGELRGKTGYFPLSHVEKMDDTGGPEVPNKDQ